MLVKLVNVRLSDEDGGFAASYSDAGLSCRRWFASRACEANPRLHFMNDTSLGRDRRSRPILLAHHQVRTAKTSDALHHDSRLLTG